MINKFIPTLFNTANKSFYESIICHHTILSGLTRIAVTDVNIKSYKYLSYEAYWQFIHLTFWHQNNCPAYYKIVLGFKCHPLLSMFLADNFRWHLVSSATIKSSFGAKRVNKLSGQPTLSIGHDPEPAPSPNLPP